MRIQACLADVLIAYIICRSLATFESKKRKSRIFVTQGPDHCPSKRRAVHRMPPASLLCVDFVSLPFNSPARALLPSTARELARDSTRDSQSQAARALALPSLCAACCSPGPCSLCLTQFNSIKTLIHIYQIIFCWLYFRAAFVYCCAAPGAVISLARRSSQTCLPV